MSPKRTTAVARVRLVIEVPIGDAWGSDCTLAQVYQQAAEAARRRVESVVKDATVVRCDVTAIVCQEEP